MWQTLTIEFLPKKSQEHGEVDGALPLVQHLIQLLVFDIKFPCYPHNKFRFKGEDTSPLF